MDSVRCPYCVERENFREMMPVSDGSFICRRCGHIDLRPNLHFDVNALSVWRFGNRLAWFGGGAQAARNLAQTPMSDFIQTGQSSPNHNQACR
jgi:hypothetical protein